MAQDLADAAASSIGGVFTVAVTYPIEIVKNRIASSEAAATGAHGKADDGPPRAQPESGAMAVARDIVRSRGLLGFYDGVTVSAVENAVEKFFYFFAYSSLRRRLQGWWGGSSTFVDLTAGTLSELAHLPVTIPFETLLIKVIHTPEKGFFGTCSAELREKGFRGLYAGTFASVVLSAKPAIQLATFESLRATWLRRQAAPGRSKATALSAGQAFLLGALARAFATLVVFPCIRAKFMMKNMKKSVDETCAQDRSLWAPVLAMRRAMELVLEQQGFGGFYHGLSQELARSMCSAALLMAVRERLTITLSSAIRRRA